MRTLSSKDLHGCRNLCIPKHFLLQRVQQMAATAPRSLHQLPCRKADHDDSAFSAPARLPQSVHPRNTSCFKGCNRWQQPRLAACISFFAERLIMRTLSSKDLHGCRNLCIPNHFLLQRVQQMAATAPRSLHQLPCGKADHEDSVFQRPARLPQSVHPETLPALKGATAGSNPRLAACISFLAERLIMRTLSSKDLHGCRNLCIPKHFLLQRVQQMAATAPRSLHQLPCRKADHEDSVFQRPARLPQSVHPRNTSCFKGCNRWQQPRLAACISFLAERLIMRTLSSKDLHGCRNLCIPNHFLLQRVQQMAATAPRSLHQLPCGKADHEDSVFQRPARLPQSVHPETLPASKGATDGSNRASQLASASLKKG